MAEKTIIIESNREIAYNELNNKRLSDGNNIFSTADEFPTHKWSTHINSLVINPGDKISLDSAQINALGSGGDVLEFIGTTGKEVDGKQLRDNAMKIESAYYVTNNQCNNFNNPKSRCQVNYDWTRNGYGGPAFYGGSIQRDTDTSLDLADYQNFDSFELSYPFQFLEGSVTQFDDINKVYYKFPNTQPYPSKSTYLPSVSKGGNSVYQTGSQKLYVGKKRYLGPFYIDTQVSYLTQMKYEVTLSPPDLVDLCVPWGYETTETILNTKEGFINPSALASGLTEQLHARDGDADYWDIETEQALLLNMTPREQFFPYPFIKTDIPAVTDNTFKTFPTCTGKILYNYLYGINNGTGGPTSDAAIYAWYGKLQTADAIAPNDNVGDAYKPYQGLQTTYQHELTSRPEYMIAMSSLIQCYQRLPLYGNLPLYNVDPLIWLWVIESFTVHTGGPGENPTYPGPIMTQFYPTSIPGSPAPGINLYPVGSYGNNCVIMDNLAFEEKPLRVYLGPYHSPDHLVDSSPVDGVIKTLKIKDGYFIGTNLLWNDVLLSVLKDGFDNYYEIISPTTSTDPNTKEFADAHAIRLNIGRLDDRESLPADPTEVLTTSPEKPIPADVGPPNTTNKWKSRYLACPYVILNPPASYANPESYKSVRITELIPGRNNGAPVAKELPALGGGFFGEENELLCHLILPDSYTAEDAFAGKLDLEGFDLTLNNQLTTSPAILAELLPDQLMDLATYKFFFWDKIPTLKNGRKMGILPLFFKNTFSLGNMGPNAKYGVYVGYIMKGLPKGNIQPIPFPRVGEFFGFSPSQLTTGSGQIATTQKILSDKEYPTPGEVDQGGIVNASTPNANPGDGWEVGMYFDIINNILPLDPRNGAGGRGVVKTVLPVGAAVGPMSTYDITNKGAYYKVGQLVKFKSISAPLTQEASVTVTTITDTPNDSILSARMTVTPQAYYPYINIGAQDPLIDFDSGQSKFALKQLHTPTTKGNGLFQRPNFPINTSDPEATVILVNPKSSAICRLYSTGELGFSPGQVFPKDPAHGYYDTLDRNVIIYNEVKAKILGKPTRSAQAGIGLYSIAALFNTGKPVELEGSVTLDILNTDLYASTMFDKMGFLFEQLQPVYGRTDNMFNRLNYNNYLGFGDNINIQQKFNNMVKPFTTNAFVDGTISFALSKLLARTFEAEDINNTPIYELAPSFNLGGMASANEGVTNGTSDALVADRLAKKLAYPYLVCYTNIITNNLYYGGPEGNSELPAIAYITRNYSEGDFFFYTGNLVHTADSNYVISQIITDLRLPDGRPAPISANSSVIYRIEKPKPLPQPVPSPEDQKKEQKAIKKIEEE